MANDKSDSSAAQSMEVILRDGRSLRLRPIKPDDKKKLEEFFYNMSERARYYRFLYVKKEISAEELKYFTEVTPPKRQAYVATTGEADKERIIAVGRWDMLSDKQSAETAFAVLDNIQLRGIGTALLEALSQAALECGIVRFTAKVLAENTAMLEVFEESGFKTGKRMNEGVYDITIELKDHEEFEKRRAWREHVARSSGARKILFPKRVAVIGASRNPESVGGAVFRNLLRDGFQGIVLPVNPQADSIDGVLAYPSVKDVPGDIDLAVIVIPAQRVLDVIDQCAQKGARGLVIISAGFGEAGAEGRERERLLHEKALSYGLRIIGPNCLGIMNNNPGVRMNATFSPVTPPYGNLSIGTQSGALGLALLDHAKAINLGIGHFVSIGNRIDISNNDLLELWEDDEDTGVIVLYLESFGNPRKFGPIARRVSHKKPIIAIKSGRSAVGAKAASSHTGALAASDVAADALFRQAGVIRVNTIIEMFNAAEVLAHQPLPKGPRVGILTNAGGPGVLAADACEALGLKVNPLSNVTQGKLREFLPKAAATANPVDMIASAPVESYKKALKVMLEDPDLDSIILIYIPPLVTKPEDVASAVREVLSGYKGGKPVVTCFMMPQEALREIRKYNLRPYIFPEDAVSALSHAFNYSVYKNMDEGKIVKFNEIFTDKIREKAKATGMFDKKGWMLPDKALSLLNEYGIPVVETIAADSADEAAQASKGLKFPVIMKVRSIKIVHKTDVGGVAVVTSEAEVKKTFSGMKERIESHGKEMEGVIIQPMISGGQEIIVGMSVDPVFGPLVMLGLGGIMVDVIKDVAFSIHPLRDVDPERMLKNLKSLPLLNGWRGRPPADVNALKETLLRFSAVIEDFPEIDQMEINPLLVLNEGSGCVAVDARIYIKG